MGWRGPGRACARVQLSPWCDLGSRPASGPGLAAPAKAAASALEAPGQCLNCTLFSSNHSFLTTELTHLSLTQRQQPTACAVGGSDRVGGSGAGKDRWKCTAPERSRLARADK